MDVSIDIDAPTTFNVADYDVRNLAWSYTEFPKFKVDRIVYGLNFKGEPSLFLVTTEIVTSPKGASRTLVFASKLMTPEAKRGWLERNPIAKTRDSPIPRVTAPEKEIVIID